MIKFIERITQYVRDESGATAIEYGLIAAAIALAIAASVFAFGGDLSEMFATMESTTSQAAARVETYDMPE